MNQFRTLIILAMLSFLTINAGAQDAPGLLHYQGRLTTSGGGQIAGPVTVTFTFWDDPTTGVQLGGFSDADLVELSAEGLYATLIGDDPDNLVPDSIFQSSSVFLNVNINGEDLMPRKRIASVAYAARSVSAASADHATTADTATTATYSTTADTATTATIAITAFSADADTLDGQDSTDFAGAVHAHNLQDLGGAVTDAQVADDITINHATTTNHATYATNAANLDGMDSTEFATAGHGHNLQDLGGVITDRQVPDTITINHATTAGSAGTADTATTSTFSSVAGAVEKIVADFVVETGESVTAGDVVTLLNSGKVRSGSQFQMSPKLIFNSGDTNDIAAVALTDKKIVIIYRDAANSFYGTALFGSIRDSTVSFADSPEVVFNIANTSAISAVALSGTKFVVAYRDNGNSHYGTAIIGDVIGSTLSFASSAEVVFNSDSTLDPAVAALSDSRFVIAYSDGGNSGYGTAIIGDVSGSTISFAGSFEVAFSSASVNQLSIALLSATKFVVAYNSFGNGTAIIGNISGSTVIFAGSSETVFNNSSSNSISLAKLNQTKFVVAYQDVGNFSYGTAIIGNVAGSTIGFAGSPEAVFNSYHTQSISVAGLSETRFAVTHTTTSPDYYSTVIHGEVSGSTINYDSSTEVVFYDENSLYTSLIKLSDTHLFAAYQAHGPPRTGEGILFSLSEVLGIAEESAAAGESVPVVLRGISDNHSGLTPGLYYYEDTDGSLTTTATARRVGLALSPTKLLLDN